MALVVAGLALAACGGGQGRDEVLTPAERTSLTRSRDAIVAHCRRIGLFIARRRGPPTVEERAEAERATDTLIALAQHKPQAVYSSAETVGLVLGDLAERLEAINCAPDIKRRLDVALARLPPS